MTDNVAVLDGHTEGYHLTSREYELFVLVRPGTDLSEAFRAWDMDSQEFIHVKGWLFSSERI